MVRDCVITEEDKKFILVFFGLVLLYLIPVLISNTFYNDDYSRIIVGNSWDDDGRLLPSLIMRFLVHSNTIYSPVPLPLILSLFVTAFGGFMVAKRFLDIKDSYTASLAAIGFVLNPFLMMLFVYQLDSLGLMLSLVLLILPFYLTFPQDRKKRYRYYLAGIACVFFSLASYQASFGFFMALAVIEIVHAVYQNRYADWCKTLFIRIMQLSVAFVAYKGFLKINFITNIARRPGRVKVLDFSLEGIHTYISHCQDLLLRIIASMSQMQLVIFGLLFVLSIYFSFDVYRRNVRSATIGNINKMLLLIVPIAPFVIFAFSFIHIAFLKGVQNVQTLTSLSGLTAFLFLVPAWMFRSQRKLGWLLTPLFIAALGFSYLIGNYVKIEHDYHQPIISAIIADVNKNQMDKSATLYYSGGLPHSVYYHRLAKTHPIIRSMDDSTWNVRYRLPYGGCPLPVQPDESPNNANLLLITDTYYYTLYRRDADLVLKLKH